MVAVKIDSKGMYIPGSDLVDYQGEQTEEIITTPVPGGFWWARWNRILQQWEEGLLPEEIEERKKKATIVPDRIAEALAHHLTEPNPHNRNAIATPYSSSNDLISSKNLQTAIDQLTAIVATQQAQIQLLLPKSLPPLVNDTFTAVDNTALDARSPEVSPAAAKWVRRAGGWKIIGGVAQSDGVAGSLAYIESGTADKVTIEADVFLVDTNVQQGLIFRLNNLTFHHWRAVYTKTKFELIEVTLSNVSRTSLIETIAFNSSYKFKVLLDGNNISFYVNNTLKLSWNSAINNAESKHGLYAATSQLTKFDNFKVTPI